MYELRCEINLNTDTVGWIKVPIPPEEEQGRVVKQLKARLSRHDLLVTRVGGQVDRLREYRQALITAAVTGQLQIPEEEAA